MEPKVETAETFLTAQQIDVVLTEDQDMEALVATGFARAIDKRDSVPPEVTRAFQNPSDTAFLEGDSLHVAFADEAIQWIVAEGRARSLYYVRESEPGPVETWALNYLLGKRLRLNFRGDTLVQVTASGGHRGVYDNEIVEVGGPRRVPSEPIPLSGPRESAAAGTQPRRARGRTKVR